MQILNSKFKMELQRNKLIAALTPIAFFRAVNGSYDINKLRLLTYKETLTDNEWREFLKLYEEKLVEEKERNQKQKEVHQELKQKLADKISRLKEITQKIPEISDILLVNSYALGSLKESSDIDLLVITKPDVLWWTRLKLTGALELAGIRRKPGHIEEQFCLSFFITENAMDMSKIALENDIYLHFWTPSITSLTGKALPAWQYSNIWLKDIFPALPSSSNPSSLLPTPYSLSRFFNILVRPIMRWRNNIRSRKLGPEASIIVSDVMFKFHNLDRRKLYREKTLEELEHLLTQVNSKF